MAHALLAVYASPKKHLLLMNHVNNRLEYDYEGQGGRGKHRPFLSELKLYDIRVKEELLPQVLADSGATTFEQRGKVSGGSGSIVKRFLCRVIRFFRWFSPLRGVQELPKPITRHGLPGWSGVWFLGSLKDKYDGEGGEVL